MTHTTRRILSGIKPTGEPHLGSYLGAMRAWPTYQADDTEVFFFIPDLHALNSRPVPVQLRSMTLDLVSWLVVMGIDPHKHPIYAQSQVPGHAELCWILNNYATMGELARQTQYKDKVLKSGPEGQLVALFDYPVLMAADILLYDADVVPVGDDQIQHIELTRDIAARFNNLYGEHFKVPEFAKQATAARIMMLDDPSRKMSKSEGGEGCVYLKDDADTIIRKFKRAVTDSETEIRYDKEGKPGISNLLEIFAALQGKTIEDAVHQFSTRSYGQLKDAVAEAVIADLVPLQEKFESLRQDEAALYDILRRGAERTGELAAKKLTEIKHVIGLV